MNKTNVAEMSYDEFMASEYVTLLIVIGSIMADMNVPEEQSNAVLAHATDIYNSIDIKEAKDSLFIEMTAQMMTKSILNALTEVGAYV